MDKKTENAIKLIRHQEQQKINNLLKSKEFSDFNAGNIHDYNSRIRKGQGQAHWRLIASYPVEIRALLIAKYGTEALKDEKFYREFLKSDEAEPFRAVPKSEI